MIRRLLLAIVVVAATGFFAVVFLPAIGTVSPMR